MVFLAIGPIAASGWWASMCTASCLCRDLASQTIENARSTDPKNAEEWQARVSRPALELIGKFELLSDGWSTGLIGVVAACWLIALGDFAVGLKGIMIDNNEDLRDPNNGFSGIIVVVAAGSHSPSPGRVGWAGAAAP